MHMHEKEKKIKKWEIAKSRAFIECNSLFFFVIPREKLLQITVARCREM